MLDEERVENGDRHRAEDKAIKDPQNRVSALMRSLTVTTGIVFMEPDDMKMSAYRNSFHDRVKQKIPPTGGPEGRGAG